MLCSNCSRLVSKPASKNCLKCSFLIDSNLQVLCGTCSASERKCAACLKNINSLISPRVKNCGCGGK